MTDSRLKVLLFVTTMFNYSVHCEVPETAHGLKAFNVSTRSMHLSWAAPPEGSSPVEKYLVQYKRAEAGWDEDAGCVFVPGNAIEASVLRLYPATKYDLRVIAKNAIGTSEPSDAVTITTHDEES